MKIARIKGIRDGISGIIELPFSKSESNRLLPLEFLSKKRIMASCLSDAEDVNIMKELLKKIGDNYGEQRQEAIELYAGNAGTVVRFLTACLSIIPGKWKLTGSARMRERPVGQLVEALRSLGADIDYGEKAGFVPILINGRDLEGGSVEFINCGSSQFITSMMLIAPFLPAGIKIKLRGTTASFSYIDLTVKIFQKIGIYVEKIGDEFFIPHQPVGDREYHIERDWSAAAFWYEILALSESGNLYLPGLRSDSGQGDKILSEIYQKFGVLTEEREKGIQLSKVGERVDNFTWDFTEYPDIVPPVAVTCAALNVEARLSGIQQLRLKESDRIESLRNEMKRMNASVMADDNRIIINRHGGLQEPDLFKTYEDHRLAMALAPLAAYFEECLIEDPHVVNKSYPGFWKDLITIGWEITFL